MVGRPKNLENIKKQMNIIQKYEEDLFLKVGSNTGDLISFFNFNRNS